MIPALKSDQFLCEICGLSRVAFTVFARGARWRRLHRLCELQKRERGREKSERKSDEEEETACAAHCPPQHFPRT